MGLYIVPCKHEEADTRIVLHLKEAVREKHNKVSIWTVGTDVMVLADTAAQYINVYKLKMITFGTGTNFQYLSIHEMAKALGPVK